MNELQQVEALVDQVKENTSFLHKIIFSRMTLIAMGIVTAIFLIAAMSAN